MLDKFVNKRKSIFGLLFGLILLALTVVAAEVASFTFLILENGHLGSKRAIQRSLSILGSGGELGAQVVAEETTVEYLRPYILHPYLGFVLNPGKNQPKSYRPSRTTTNEYGFWGPSPLSGGGDSHYSIAIMGGSVAAKLYTESLEPLAIELQKAGRFSDKPVHFISIALGGMKQPQQLMALSYFLSLGAHFDAVINLDGFNELALPMTENVRFGVNPLYPRAWRWLATKTVTPSETVIIGRISLLRQRMDSVARWLRNSWLKESYTVLAIWRQYSERMAARQRELEALLGMQSGRNRTLTAQESGPPFSSEDEKLLLDELAHNWRESSRLLWALCKEYGIPYFHFLQPNQYFSGTRVLTGWERKHAFRQSGNPYARYAEAGYPAIVAAGKELTAVGVPFFDLSKIFLAEPRTVYVDDCCHYNAVGNEILAKAIADVLARRDSSSMRRLAR